MHYEINVSFAGRHFFATAKHSIDTKEKLKEVLEVMVKKFPEKEGYELMVSYRTEGGCYLNNAALVDMGINAVVKMPGE